MMLVDRSGVIGDTWAVVDGEEPLPQGPVILPFDRVASAVGRNQPTGVHLANDTDPADVEPYFPDLAIISIDFPSFADGRGFSIGRCLRERGFKGRLRATGPVIADQFAYLLECGFDEVAVAESVAKRQPAERWLAQLSKVTLSYQRGREGRASILDRRRAAQA
ncbi:MAG: DUF934 domain-containing protein [Pseudomonadota bacterium]